MDIPHFCLCIQSSSTSFCLVYSFIEVSTQISSPSRQPSLMGASPPPSLTITSTCFILQYLVWSEMTSFIGLLIHFLSLPPRCGLHVHRDLVLLAYQGLGWSVVHRNALINVHWINRPKMGLRSQQIEPPSPSQTCFFLSRVLFSACPGKTFIQTAWFRAVFCKHSK